MRSYSTNLLKEVTKSTKVVRNYEIEYRVVQLCETFVCLCVIAHKDTNNQELKDLKVSPVNLLCAKA